MANDCSNYIRISGSVEKMKPIYDFFENGQKKIDLYYTQKKEFIKDNPSKTIWDEIDGIKLEEQLVMSTLVPKDKDYDKIVKSRNFLLSPYTTYYGCKWDFDLSQANVNDCIDELVTLSPTTPWSPPTEFCRRLSKKYGVNVYIFYSEGGCDFTGLSEYDNGEITNEEQYGYLEGLYKLDKECFWSEIDMWLDDTDDITEEEFLNKVPFINDVDRETIRKDFQTAKVN